jgi:hypothetical protein
MQLDKKQLPLHPFSSAGTQTNLYELWFCKVLWEQLMGLCNHATTTLCRVHVPQSVKTLFGDV